MSHLRRRHAKQSHDSRTEPPITRPGPRAGHDNVRALPHRALEELITARSPLSPARLGEALTAARASSRRIGEVLTDVGALGEHALATTLAQLADITVSDLRTEAPQPAAVAMIPADVARRLLAVPMRVSDGCLVVAVAAPSDEIRKELEAASGSPVRLTLAPRGDLSRAIETSYRATSEIDNLVASYQATESARRRNDDLPDEHATAEDAPVVQIVNRILVQALRDRASDVHIEPQSEAVRVRYRIDGALKDVVSLPGDLALSFVSRIKIMAGMNIVERRRPQDGKFSTTFDGKSVDVRVATTSTIWGEKCVMRLLDKSRSLLRLGDLGMSEATHTKFARLARSPFGMVLCAGPTGSGKTTSLYATLTEVNDPSRNVMTIEDPVEYVFASINQIQTNDQAGVTFATGLKSILRQDPDVILVGEIRDVETARVAVQSALTGHLVLSSLHATDSVSALHRLLDMGIESFLVASSVLAIVGQRLVRRSCPACKVPYTPSEEELAFYHESEGPEKSTFYRGEGCNLCAGTGYQDRIGVYELLQMTPEIKRLVVGWATQDELRRLAQKQGMRTLREEAIDLVAQDVTTISEVIRSIYAN